MDDNTPKKFVGIHAHSIYSLGDGFSRPKEHIEFALENNLDGHCLTEHGHANNFAELVFLQDELKKKGKQFKIVGGVESYYVDSLSHWKELYLNSKSAEKKAKEDKKKKTAQEELDSIGDDSIAAKEEVKEKFGDLINKDEDSGSVMENEEESKDYKKFFDPIKQRNHLVLLPKNNEGLKSLFQIVSESHKDGFYKFPRVDLDMLRKHSKKNLIASSACIGGKLVAIVAMNQTKDFQTELHVEAFTDNFEKIQKELAQQVSLFQEALGSEENFYLELQFNKLPLQHLANYHLIECAKRTGAPLVVTCDSHYSRPELWREREIYKAMLWSSRTKDSTALEKIPEKIEQLKCELYPKNAEQVWQSYKQYGKDFNFYDDHIIKNAIENSWHIVHEQIDNSALSIDRKVKLPSLEKLATKEEIIKIETRIKEKKLKLKEKKKDTSLSVNEDEIQFELLKQHAIDGLIKRGFGENKEYINRLILELDTVKHLGIVSYFLTYEKIMQIVGAKMLTGTARGSAGGSLLAYVLDITQMDPIKHGLLFERFLSKKKAGFADVDSDSADREEALKIITDYFGEDSVLAISTFGQLQLKSLIKDLGRLYNVPLEELNQVTLLTDKETRAVAKGEDDYDGTTWFLTYDDAAKNSPTFKNFIEKYPEVDKSIKNLFKNYRSIGRHAGGVVISDNLYANMPVIKSGKTFQTPWTEGLNAHQLEPLGFLKFDILALGTLRMFQDTITKIVAKQKNIQETEVKFEDVKKWYYDNVHPDNNKMDEQEVYEYVYHKGNFAGIFQFAQKPVQTFVQKLKPRSVEDIALATSTFRPGPLKGGVDKMLLTNRENPDSVEYKHPMLKNILKNEAGCIAENSYVETTEGLYYIQDIVDDVNHGNKVIIPSYNVKTNEIEEDEILFGELTGHKSTITLKFDDQTELTLTEDHLVFTKNRGYVEAKDLTNEDEILSVN